MQIALHCGLPSRRQLYEQLTSAELVELEILHGLEPFGDRRADFRAAMIASASMSAFGGKPPDPIKLMPFMPKQKKSTEAMFAAAKRAIKGDA